MKKIKRNVLTGSIGEDTLGMVIEKELGFVWRPTSRHDTGYDGELELRDELTEEVSGLIVKVQSKSLQDFDSEDDKEFIYRCSKEDMDYWINSNVPDIIVISRARKNELYWSPIKQYFELNPDKKTKRVIKFDKNKNKFNASAKEEISKLAIPIDKGLYVAPLPKKEEIYSNLLEVISYPKKIYIAPTVKPIEEIFAILREGADVLPQQWILGNDIITSFNNLNDPIWEGIFDKGAVEEYDTSDWVESEDQEKELIFIQLLNRNFLKLCWDLKISFDRVSKCYYFQLQPGTEEREEKYKSRLQNTSRKVVTAGYLTQDSSKPQYFRHFAFEANFTSYDNKLYLEISPTYHMTKDGNAPDRLKGKRISGMKKLQRNSNVLGEIIFIARFLNSGSQQNAEKESLVKFGDLLKLELTAGIDDKQWRGTEEEEIFVEKEYLEEGDEKE